MSKLQLSVELDRHPPEFCPGDQISGRVRVVSEEAWDVREFTVALYWKTAGMGTEDSGTAFVEELTRQGTRIGTVGDYRFRMTAPPMPWTYHGTLLKIHWFVAINARGTRRGFRTTLEIPISIHPDLSRKETPPPAPFTVPIPDAPPE